MFDAMVHHKIDTEGLSFEPHIADVEALNQQAMEQDVAITKLSYHAFAYLATRYRILASGSALGKGNGPLLVSKSKITPADLKNCFIAIPGEYTTAALLLKIAYPQLNKLKEYLFSDIEAALLQEKITAGVLIHEGRFTYADKGLQLIDDLGKKWEARTGQAIPLGGIAVSRQLDSSLKEKIARILRRSIEFAFKYPHESTKFSALHAQEMDAAVMAQHIALYVNDYSIDLGNDGRKAVRFFLKEAVRVGVVHAIPDDIFV
jgi:1,4-dihydroxy-6-naphthoate synthase